MKPRRTLLVVLTMCQGSRSAGASTQSACLFMSYVIHCICALKGRTFVRQRPAGCSKWRVADGKLQPPGHGDTSSLHVPGGEHQRNHPAGCTEGYEGTHQREIASSSDLNKKTDFPVFFLKILILVVAKIRSNSPR